MSVIACNGMFQPTDRARETNTIDEIVDQPAQERSRSTFADACLTSSLHPQLRSRTDQRPLKAANPYRWTIATNSL
jgi:hypothetical protein